MITKREVIERLCESGAAMSDESRAEFEQLIAEWVKMPAAAVIAEAESVFGWHGDE